MQAALVCAKPSLWSVHLSIIQVEATIHLNTHTPCHSAHGLHHILAPCAVCFSKGHYHPLLMSQTHASSCCCYGTMPRLILSWCNTESWHCAHDSLSVHEALCPHVSHPTSLLELALLLRHLYVASKQQAMALHPCLFELPCTRHCALVPLSGGESASRPMPLQPQVTHHHMLWSPCVGANKVCLVSLAHVRGQASRHKATIPQLESPTPPLFFSSVSLLKSISGWFRSFWRRHHSCLRRNNEPV